MKRYIEQLIEDLHQATWSLKPPHELWEVSEANPDDELELEDMSYVEKYVYGDKLPISEITGIGQEQLPPDEKLTQEEQALLAIELQKLLQYFHFNLDFPKDYPAHLRYVFIRNFWNEKQVPLSFGENHIEFCDYNEANCPFPEYCSTCKEVLAEMECGEQLINQEDSTDDFDANRLLPTPEEIEAWAKGQNFENGREKLEDIFGIPGNDDPANDFISGFFNDDGTPIDPKTVPVPSLCIICKSYSIDDPEENFLCMLNRNDQRNDPDFICGAFEKT